jgi:hypothetical protein
MKEYEECVTSPILILAGKLAKILIDFIFISHYHSKLMKFGKFCGSLMR